MMCLGWTNKPYCAARNAAQVVPPSNTAVVVGPGTTGVIQAGGACPDVSWFWLGMAAVVVGAVVKKA